MTDQWLAVGLMLAIAGGCSGQRHTVVVATKKPIVVTAAALPAAPPRQVVLPDSEQLVNLLADPSTRDQTTRDVLAAAERGQPPVLLVVAALLFEKGDRDEAVFWHFLAMLRGQADAMRCTDVTAQPAISILSAQLGAKVNAYAYQNPEQLRVTVQKVLAWDRAHPYDYDPTWIAAHGLRAMSRALAAAIGDMPAREPVAPVEPREKWDEIILANRKDFESRANQSIDDAKSRGNRPR